MKSVGLEEIVNSILKGIKKKDNEIKKLNNIIEEVNKYIIANFTNQDGTIWHEDMRDIYNILKKESD